MQAPRCHFEGGPWNPPLMRVPLVPLAVAVSSKAGLCDRSREAREIAEVPKLADGLGTVTTDVVLHDCGERAKPFAATKAAAAWVGPLVRR